MTAQSITLPKRLLCIVGCMEVGGAETFLMKLYRKLDRSKYQMDFCEIDAKRGSYEDEILRLGGRIVHSFPKSLNPIKSFNSVSKIVREGNYESVLRISQNSMSSLDLLAAKFGGAKLTSFRSSNSNTCGGTASALVHCLGKALINRVADVKIAPSTKAGVFMFGRRAFERGEVALLKNAVDVDEYSFNAANRNMIRKELGIQGDALVIGHIGRMTAQKNHLFLIDMFMSIHEAFPNSYLVLAGKGELENDISRRICDLGIADFVRMVGVRSDVPALLSSFDVFVLPSLFEGMPNVVIEAQANGLPCVISHTITGEANVSGMVSYLPIDSPDDWVGPVVERARAGRYDGSVSLRLNGYDINEEVKNFVELVYS